MSQVIQHKNNNLNREIAIKSNLSEFNEILKAEEVCLSKLNSIYENRNNNLSCCSFVITIYENNEICDIRLLYENNMINNDIISNNHVKQMKPYYDNYCNKKEYTYLIYNNITISDYNNCIKYNELKSEDTMSYLDYKNKETIPIIKRVLQLNGFINHFNIPSASTHIMSQSISTQGSFLHSEVGTSCSPLLSLIFVRVCNTICNSHHNSSSGRNSIPLFCIRDCQQFSKYACLRGCRKYGCKVDLYTCMELMCQ
ncbi:hypothetical protein FG386_001494 [Cryptosporidium ryanae]|uniref:uncharacterized protein n=1 Tax=Cryptosporidium ryanae TaxID=515981 RepID=UPI00351A885E|nr:hypothetical protein FG386_001494 [Cryptosporidium ryanae]